MYKTSFDKAAKSIFYKHMGKGVFSPAWEGCKMPVLPIIIWRKSPKNETNFQPKHIMHSTLKFLSTG